MRRNNLFSSTGVKLAAACAALFCFASLMTTGVAYYLIAEDLDALLDRSLGETSSYLLNEYKEGAQALVDSVDQHARASRGNDEIFLLTDHAGKKISGNVDKFSNIDGWHDADPAEFGLTGQRSFRVLTQRVGDLTLTVARSDSGIDEIGAIIEKAFGVGAIIMGFSALVAALLIGHRAQKRVESFSSTLNAVSLGDMTRRIDVQAGGGDDIDHIARSLNKTLDHLSSAMLSMQHVTVDIAHDLKSPIARLRNRLIDCIASLEPASNARVELQEAIGEADNITQNFEAMLRISQIESGDRRKHFAALNLNEVVARAIEIYGAVVEDAGGTLIQASDPQSQFLVFGEERLVLQLLANLIENSLKHSISAPQITIGITQETNGTHLCVADSGPGIPQSETENVKQRFYRLDKSRSTKGSGLGLALVSAISTLHDATFTLADNQPGLRANVIFTPVESA